jgi:hypothetical protein
VWRTEILAGHDAGLISREMARRCMLKTNADGKPQTKQRLPDGTGRKVYVVQPAFFDGGASEGSAEPSGTRVEPM